MAAAEKLARIFLRNSLLAVAVTEKLREGKVSRGIFIHDSL